MSHGAFKGQKNERPPRTVRLLAPLRADLAQLWIAAGRPADDELLFPTAADAPWPLHDWQNWRRRTFGAAVRALDLSGAVPYDLRHSFASLLIHEGLKSVVEIAGYFGHAPSVTLDTYAHVIEELRGAERIPADERIAKARRDPGLFPAHEPTRATPWNRPRTRKAP